MLQNFPAVNCYLLSCCFYTCSCCCYSWRWGVVTTIQMTIFANFRQIGTYLPRYQNCILLWGEHNMTVVNVILSRSKYLSLFFQDLIAELYPGSVQLNFFFTISSWSVLLFLTILLTDWSLNQLNFFPFLLLKVNIKKRIYSNYAEEELEINTIQFFNLTIVIMVIIRHCPNRLLVDLNQRIYSTVPLNRILK